MIRPLPPNWVFISMMFCLMFVAVCHTATVIHLNSLPDTTDPVNIEEYLRTNSWFYAFHITEILAICVFAVLMVYFTNHLMDSHLEYSKEEVERLKKEIERTATKRAEVEEAGRRTDEALKDLEDLADQ